MNSRLLTRGVRAPVIAVLAAAASLVGLAAAPAPAHAQFSIGAVAGTVSASGGPLQGVAVTATPFAGGSGGATATTDPAGHYTLAPLQAGDYRISFRLNGYVREYYDDAVDPAAADPVTVNAFATTSPIDAVLEPEAAISGTVTDSSAVPAEGVCVSASPDGGGVESEIVHTGASGAYTITSLAAGSYKIKFDPCDSPNNLLTEWWDDKPSELAADSLTVSAGETRTGIDASLPSGGSISGTVLNSHGLPAAGAQVNVFTPFGILVESRSAAANGTYVVDQLSTGSYRVGFVTAPGTYDLSEYYDDQPTITTATPVGVLAGSDTGSVNAELAGDTIPPALTIDSGPSGPTNESTPTFTFSTESDASVLCSIDTGTPDYGPCSGATSHTPATALDDDSYTFRVQATDPSTNSTVATRDFVVDTQPPSVSVTGGPSGTTGFSAPTFTFSAEYSESTPTFECAIDPVGAGVPSYGSCTTTSSHTSAPLADGSYVFRVRATDPATNAAVAQRSFTVDSDGPEIQISGGPSGPTQDATPSFDFSASPDATLECAVDPASDPLPDYGACSSATGHTSAPLTDGDYVFRVRASDDAAHSAVDQRSFSVDTTAPLVNVTGGPSGPTNDTTPNFDFTSNEGALQCAVAAGVDSPAYGACGTSTGHTADPLSDGSYTFYVRATDAAGNAATAQRSFSVDTVSPALSITGGPTGPTNDSTPSFDFTSNEGVFQCAVAAGVDSPAYGACSGPGGHTSAELLDGSYTFYVRATDGAGNAATAQRSFSVDTVAPVLSITGGPSGPTNDTTPNFDFTSNEGVLHCAVAAGVDSPAYGACGTSTGHTSDPLSDGNYTFSVRSTDAAGNVATAQRSFSVDTTAPSLSITGGPSGPTNDTTPSFDFISNEGALQCAVAAGVDSPAYGACGTSTGHTADPLSDGNYTFYVRAIDAAGNATTAQRSFSVDTVAPVLSITGGPNGPTNDTTPNFDFTSNEGAFECAVAAGVDSPAYGACSGPGGHTSAELSDGSYTFYVRATDAAGNAATAQRGFSVDTVSPVLSITGGPSGPTNDTTPNFDFTSDDGAVQCAVAAGTDTPAYGACGTSTGHTADSLSDGNYTFYVRATDAAGNVATAQRSFSVDTAVALTIDSGPSGMTRFARPTFAFTAENGATVECSTDEGTPSYGPCSGASSHTPPTALPDGDHTFRVRALDAAGNTVTEQRSFTVDTVAPALSITGGPAGETTDPVPVFTFSAETLATISCSIDTGTASFGPCSGASSHSPSTPLADGSYSFRVRATDAAGNVSNSLRSFELDAPTAPPPVDTSPPTISITGGPAGKTKDTTPTFAFTTNDSKASFACVVDGGPAVDCTSPTTLKKLKRGKKHTFSVTATDRAGNSSAPATRSFTVKKKKRKKGK